ncbi:MAG: hypothetical protein AB7E55_01345 [Pigmentiphaga sp.]
MSERSKPRRYVLNVCPEVAAFAQAMERQLRANDHKPHWRQAGPQQLLAHLIDEVQELIEATRSYTRALEQAYSSADGCPTRTEVLERICHEAADVGNFAMMVADVVGALEEEPPCK